MNSAVERLLLQLTGRWIRRTFRRASASPVNMDVNTLKEDTRQVLLWL